MKLRRARLKQKEMILTEELSVPYNTSCSMSKLSDFWSKNFMCLLIHIVAFINVSKIT